MNAATNTNAAVANVVETQNVTQNAQNVSVDMSNVSADVVIDQQGGQDGGLIVVAVVIIVIVGAMIAAGFAIWKWYDPKTTVYPGNGSIVPVGPVVPVVPVVPVGPVGPVVPVVPVVPVGPVVSPNEPGKKPTTRIPTNRVPTTRVPDVKNPVTRTTPPRQTIPNVKKNRNPTPVPIENVKNIWTGQHMTITPSTAASGKKTFMPYVEWDGAKPQNTSSATFAFITSMHGKTGWEAGGSVSDLVNVVKTMKSFRISFGGQGSTELAQAIKDVPTLIKTYQTIIDTYGAKWLDFDIEDDKALSDTGSIDRRNAALAQLQKSNPGLKIDYTLNTDEPGGLESPSLNILKNAKAHGVNINCVNPMTFDNGHFSDNAGTIIETVQNVKKQVDSIGLPGTTIGITVMVGKDDNGQMFSLSDASKILAFAKSTSWISLLSFWSEALDAKTGYAYSKVFSAFDT